MPKVNVYQGGLVESQGPNPMRFRPVETAPSVLATGLRAIGAGIQQIAETEAAVKATVDEADAKHAFNQYLQTSDQVLHTGENAFYSLTGKAAVDQRATTEKALRDAGQGLLDSSRSPEQRRMLSEALESRIQEDLKGVGSHAIDQGIRYNIDESAARTTLSGSDAVRNYLDPKIAETSIATGLTEIENRGRLEHWSPDRIAAETLKWESGVRRDIGTRFVYESDQGPDIARTYAERFKDHLTPDDAFAIDSAARVQANSLAAEQRRLEAEAKREAREQAREAGQRAEDTLRLINDGVPVPAPVLASALEDARTSGRGALEDSIKTGGFKNNLTVEYRDHTPAEIQNRLNVLGATIKKAGDHPDPNDVIEFDHLSHLRDKSAADLNRDPLSWGASHLGIQVPRLDIANPASIRARVTAATRISQRTGAPIRPLTDDEAAALTPTVAHGSIEERRTLIQRLANFGSAGTLAAEQIAPNDSAFHALVGLATSRNRPAAALYIGYALQGPEALKKNPKLVKDAEAQARFARFAGGAFRLLPNVSTAVYQNALNILAGYADQKGMPDWEHAQGEFEGSVNGALGSYVHNGVRYGGLGIWQGERVILPDGMSQDEFDHRLSRSSTDMLNRGGNGTPVWSNGKRLNLGEFKRMHLVAVGDGIYRVSDGRNYIARAEGGFYEMNVNRVGTPIGH
jgi:hypothetical protein